MQQADDAQVVLLTEAVRRPLPQTTGQPSVFQRAVGRKRVGAPDPRSLNTIQGPPPPLAPTCPPSPWKAVYDSMKPGEGKVMTHQQALAFAAWARQHKLKVTRRRLSDDEYGVWRAEAAT